MLLERLGGRVKWRFRDFLSEVSVVGMKYGIGHNRGEQVTADRSV